MVRLSLVRLTLALSVPSALAARLFSISWIAIPADPPTEPLSVRPDANPWLWVMARALISIAPLDADKVGAFDPSPVTRASVLFFTSAKVSAPES